MLKLSNDQAYRLGVKLAMEALGLEVDEEKLAVVTMDPTVQRGIQERRTSAAAEGNRFAGGWSPNVPKTPTEQAMSAPSGIGGGVPKLPPIDYSQEASKPSRYTQQIAQQAPRTRSR